MHNIFMRRSVKNIALAAMFLLATSIPSLAGVALDRTVTLKQPDGVVFKATPRGDEHAHWYETKTGSYAVVKDASGKRWVFSDKKLKPLNVEFKPGVKAPSNAAIKLKRVQTSFQAQKLFVPLRNSMKSMATEVYWVPRPVSGTVPVLVVRINFADFKLRGNSADVAESMFGNTNSVRRYFLDQSKGKLQLESADIDGVKYDVVDVMMTSADFNSGNHPNNFVKYESGNNTQTLTAHSNETQIITQALRHTGLNLSRFDTDNDGVVEHDELAVIFKFAGYEESSTSKTPSVWAHSWFSLGGNAGHFVELFDSEGNDTGAYLEMWQVSGELTDGNTPSGGDVIVPFNGLVVHELGHQLCQLPDLYDTSGTNAGIGIFSVMGAGEWGHRSSEFYGQTPVNMDAWCRQYLGWDKFNKVEPALKNQTISCEIPFGQTSPVRINGLDGDAYQYVLAEVRNPNSDGWDGGIKGRMLDYGYAVPDNFKGGTLLERIDERVGAGNSAAGNDFNTYVSGGHQGCMAVWADGNSNAQGAGVGSYKSLWYHGNGTTPLSIDFYTADTSPSPSVETGIVLGKFSNSSENMTFILKGTDDTIPSEDPSGEVVSGEVVSDDTTITSTDVTTSDDKTSDDIGGGDGGNTGGGSTGGSSDSGSGGGGGCNAGFAGLLLLPALPFAAKKKH